MSNIPRLKSLLADLVYQTTLETKATQMGTYVAARVHTRKIHDLRSQIVQMYQDKSVPSPDKLLQQLQEEKQQLWELLYGLPEEVLHEHGIYIYNISPEKSEEETEESPLYRDMGKFKGI